MIRTILISMLVLGSAACDSSDEDDTAEAAVRAVERAHREAARKVERVSEAIRGTAADGSLLVNEPEPPDGGGPDGGD